MNYRSVLEVDMSTLAQKVLHTRTVPGYDRSLYEARRTTFTARDGTLVPCSMVRE